MNLFRMALEEEQVEDNKSIIMKGPLAENYTKALDIAYQKDPETGEKLLNADGESVMAEDPTPEEQAVATESEAIDVMMAKEIAKSMADKQAPPTDLFQTVYGVSKDAIDEETVVDVSKELANASDGTDFVLVIDGCQPGPNSDSEAAPTERMVELTGALECLVQSYGGKVYRSFKEYCKTRVK